MAMLSINIKLFFSFVEGLENGLGSSSNSSAMDLFSADIA